MRFAIRLISCTKLTRYRVRSRSSRIGCGGTKLPRSNPCCSKSAIHSLSFWSVFRPGAALICCAFTSNTSQHTCGNTLLMYVQTTTAGIDNFHRATPFHRAASDASKKRKSPTRALRNFRRLQFVVLPSVPAILVSGLYSTRVGRPLSPRGYPQRYRNSTPFSSFVVVPGGDHDLLVTQGLDGIETGGFD